MCVLGGGGRAGIPSRAGGPNGPCRFTLAQRLTEVLLPRPRKVLGREAPALPTCRLLLHLFSSRTAAPMQTRVVAAARAGLLHMRGKSAVSHRSRSRARLATGRPNSRLFPADPPTLCRACSWPPGTAGAAAKRPRRVSCLHFCVALLCEPGSLRSWREQQQQMLRGSASCARVASIMVQGEHDLPLPRRRMHVGGLDRRHQHQLLDTGVSQRAAAEATQPSSCSTAGVRDRTSKRRRTATVQAARSTASATPLPPPRCTATMAPPLRNEYWCAAARHWQGYE